MSQRPYEGETLFSIPQTKKTSFKGAHTIESHTSPSLDIPKWSALLVEAVNKPGLIMEAYSAFHNYSIGNQILALVQCQLRGLEPGPINTFPGWQTLGGNVKRGERALILCMPITHKVRDEETSESDGDNRERTFTSFLYKPRWFVISQTRLRACLSSLATVSWAERPIVYFK